MGSRLLYYNTDIVTDLNILINKAKAFGLGGEDIYNAKEYLGVREYDACIDVLLTQMFEYYIEVDRSFVDLTYSLLDKMDLNSGDYRFVDELCNDEV